MQETPRLEANAIRMTYYQPRTGRKVLALSEVNLKLKPGEFMSVVGPSGCGKTTFLNITMGLVTQTGGSLLLDGKAMPDRPGAERSMVFQDSSLLPWRTVLGNVTYGLEAQKRFRPQDKATAVKMIETVGLKGFEEHYPNELSGGMQQRVNLARALMCNPDLLLMDEPFAALDAQTRELMQSELLRIWRENQKTVLFVTHQLNEAIFLSDRVAVFSARPGHVKEIVEIDLPRPRKLSMKRTARFLELEDQLWNLIEEEVQQAQEQEHEAAAAHSNAAG